MKFKYVPPPLVKKIFHSYKWETSNNKVLMTFDDGPIPDNTEIILKKLNDYSIKALFFCVGNNVQKYPELAAQILNEGHTIGNHTMNHCKVTDKDFDPDKEINGFNKQYLDMFGSEVKYFRPPHGRFNRKTAEVINKYVMTPVMWSLMTYDYKNNFNEVKYSIDKYLKSDSIVVMHDNYKCKEIIGQSIDYAAQKVLSSSFEFGTPEECLK